MTDLMMRSQQQTTRTKNLVLIFIKILKGARKQKTKYVKYIYFMIILYYLLILWKRAKSRIWLNFDLLIIIGQLFYHDWVFFWKYYIRSKNDKILIKFFEIYLNLSLLYQRQIFTFRVMIDSNLQYE